MCHMTTVVGLATVELGSTPRPLMFWKQKYTEGGSHTFSRQNAFPSNYESAIDSIFFYTEK